MSTYSIFAIRMRSNRQERGGTSLYLSLVAVRKAAVETHAEADGQDAREAAFGAVSLLHNLTRHAALQHRLAQGCGRALGFIWASHDVKRAAALLHKKLAVDENVRQPGLDLLRLPLCAGFRVHAAEIDMKCAWRSLRGQSGGPWRSSGERRRLRDGMGGRLADRS